MVVAQELDGMARWWGPQHNQGDLLLELSGLDNHDDDLPLDFRWDSLLGDRSS